MAFCPIHVTFILSKVLILSIQKALLPINILCCTKIVKNIYKEISDIMNGRPLLFKEKLNI